MSDKTSTLRRDLSRIGVFAVVLYLGFRILQPFLASIFLALILTTLTAPTYEFLVRQLKGHRNVAAVLVCVGLTVAIFLPLLLSAIAVGMEAEELYERLGRPELFNRLRDWLENGQNPVAVWLREWLGIDVFGLQARVEELALPVLGAVGSFVRSIFMFLASYAVTLVILFFMLRDSSSFVNGLQRISPFTTEEERLFLKRFREVTHATVIGNGLTAAAQGTAMALLFLMLDIPNAFLWGAIGGLLSLLPLIGMAFIWVPWAVYLFASGDVLKGILLVSVQTLAVGSLDNILRPLLIQGRARMHTLLTFFSILGGVAYFGLLGLLFGPLIFALALTCLDVFLRTSESRLQSGQAAGSVPTGKRVRPRMARNSRDAITRSPGSSLAPRSISVSARPPMESDS